jgi:hypothetical protein
MGSMLLTDGTPRARRTLALDVVSLALFVGAGMRNHRTGSQVDVFLRNAVPVLVAWLALSAVWRTYRPVSLTRLVLTWGTAVPLGLLVRTWWVGSPTGGRIALFLAVGMGFTALFLSGGRLLNAVVGRLAARVEPGS